MKSGLRIRQDPLISNDEFSGQRSKSRDVGAGVAFLRELDGRVSTFESKAGRFIDLETGSEWNLSGRAMQGPLSRKQLEPLVHGNHFWFSWAVFRPDTRIFGL